MWNVRLRKALLDTKSTKAREETDQEMDYYLCSVKPILTWKITNSHMPIQYCGLEVATYIILGKKYIGK